LREQKRDTRVIYNITQSGENWYRMNGNEFSTFQNLIFFFFFLKKGEKKYILKDKRPFHVGKGRVGDGKWFLKIDFFFFKKIIIKKNYE